jgi:UrcA family protein
MNTKSKLALLAAALISTTALAAPSRSLVDDQVTQTETVKFKTTDVSTVEGASALYAKLQEAALRVCLIEAPASIAADVAAAKACANDALTTAVGRLAIPMVSVLHLQAAKPTLASR